MKKKGLHILVVDDNPTNLKLISDLLTFEGHEIERAVDAMEAEQALAKSHPDLVLLDIALPGMDGLMLTRKLRENPATQALCIIALTASAMRGDEDKAREAGFDGYITKPVNTRLLPGQIKDIMKCGWRGKAPSGKTRS
jgi:CheY-like chemotaxis protein